MTPKKPTTPKRTRRLLARAATMNHANDEFDDYGPEPNMKLSHAFLVVLLLHVVAVGGLYAFNSLKASRQTSIRQGASADKVAKSTDSKDSSDSRSDSGGGDNGEKPPGEHSAPAPVAKVAKVTKASETTRSVARDEQAAPSSGGLLASARAMIAKATGTGAVAASTTTLSAQDSPTNPTTQVTAGTPNQQTYTVKAGDTLTRIAATLGVAIPDLEKTNNLAGNSVLQVGQVLKVPAQALTQAVGGLHNEAVKAADTVAKIPSEISSAPSAVAASSPTDAVTTESASTAPTSDYTVVKGDNPWKIAKKFKISQDALMKANGITDPKKIQIGQVLKIPAATGKGAQTKK